MNQKDEIKKQAEKLEALKLELDKAEYIFDTKYTDVQKNIDRITAERHALYEKLELLKLEIARTLSPSPKEFKDGYTHELREDLLQYGREAQRIVWDNYHAFMKDVPELQHMSILMDSMWDAVSKIEEKALGYHYTVTQIAKLKDEIKATQRFIDDLKKPGYFRQHAKEMKAQDLQKQARKETDERMKKFTAWFDETYIPKMKKAVADFTAKNGGEN